VNVAVKAKPWANLEERTRLASLCRRDPQWRKFAEELAELRPTLEAYKNAGYVPHRGNAARLARQAEVQAYKEELMDEAAEFAGIRRASVVLRVDRVGRANLADFYEPDGVTLKNIKDLPRELAEAIAGIEWQIVGQDSEGNPIRAPHIKVHDKNQANFVLLKLFGGLPDPEPPRSQTNILNVLSVDDQVALAGLLEALSGGEAPAGAGAAKERGPA
jgi:hypothetical protein